MEIEAKFRATRRIRPSDIEAIDLYPYRLGERERHNLRDTLLDSETFAVRQSRHSLRLRLDNDIAYLTLKGPKVVQGATHIRQETEVPLGAGDPLLPQTWNNALSAPVRAIVGDAPLQPLITIHNRRRSWMVYHEGEPVAEIALDRGKIMAGEARERLHELEIELKGEGSAAHLEALIARVTAALPLEAEPRSKAQRAWALWERVFRTDDALQAAAQRVPMRGEAPLAEAARSVLAGYVQRLRHALPIAIAGEDPEGVHQARVVTRRLRAILAQLAGAVYEPGAMRALRRGLRLLARRLGAVRDADVVLLALEASAPEQGGAPLKAVRRRRENAREKLLAHLESAQQRGLMERLVTFATAEGSAVVRREDALPPRVRDFAGSALWGRYEAVRAYEPNIASAELSALHHLRIEIKQLRYLLELFDDGREANLTLRADCAAAQDHLGALQDTVAALAMLDDAEDAQRRGALLQQQRALYNKTTQELSALFGEPFRERLAGLIAAL